MSSNNSGKSIQKMSSKISSHGGIIAGSFAIQTGRKTPEEISKKTKEEIREFVKWKNPNQNFFLEFHSLILYNDIVEKPWFRVVARPRRAITPTEATAGSPFRGNPRGCDYKTLFQRSKISKMALTRPNFRSDDIMVRRGEFIRPIECLPIVTGGQTRPYGKM